MPQIKELHPLIPSRITLALKGRLPQREASYGEGKFKRMGELGWGSAMGVLMFTP
ncbi:MAG: hypothetical protein HC903_01560 [Methylacidiphilales bacterium]|nr:hypothetical protein [Candidatus Methylacidiphilales bacterium]NJR17700.1 hypothetical protein [Calothrix sp. CSU_2_0]